MCDETGKKSMKIATWAIMANMPLKLKAEVTGAISFPGRKDFYKYVYYV
jgi:hypothetical protein